MPKTLGIIGWRGMVGSVLMGRMEEEGDFKFVKTRFYSTSNAGGKAPKCSGESDAVLGNAKDVDDLKQCDVIISCQGGDYTKEILPNLRAVWDGYWIDAASTKRMDSDTVICLDPVNRDVMINAIKNGTKTFAGGNCTVSLMLMALGGLFKAGLVEWMTSMSYQAASGSGQGHMKELVTQMGELHDTVKDTMDTSTAVEVEEGVRETPLTTAAWGHPLAGSLLPWIDKGVEAGQTREEWKGDVETNKILGLTEENKVIVDGLCVRVGVLRCHSQAFMIKLKKDVPISEIEFKLATHNEWVSVIPNTKEATLADLTPAAISGSLRIHVGRIHKMKQGGEYLAAFSVGDQLLWGAAEPLRRTLKILLEH